jgi:hypothetical protein
MAKRKQVLPLFFIDDKIDTGAMILSSNEIDPRSAGHLRP